MNTQILLIKPQRNNTYIRKLTMSYGYTSPLAITSPTNHITHIGIKNTINIKKIQDFNNTEKHIIGTNKIKKLNPQDLMNIYTINKTIPLNKKIPLTKKCNNMRHTTPTETQQIKTILQQQLQTNTLQITNKNNNTTLNITLNLNTTPTKTINKTQNPYKTKQTTLI